MHVVADHLRQQLALVMLPKVTQGREIQSPATVLESESIEFWVNRRTHARRGRAGTLTE